ncbi:MAG: hypothetical protein ACE5OZ_18775 [Candidatus Heimdallarchaeota archaeon]
MPEKRLNDLLDAVVATGFDLKNRDDIKLGLVAVGLSQKESKKKASQIIKKLI